ncbi:hypothetical protein GLA29479_1692 [Lysobacter antibioticus]|nr:hypothetical protein GLA29479_1692 [Lysobacter antibioticus]
MSDTGRLERPHPHLPGAAGRSDLSGSGPAGPADENPSRC